MATLLLTGFDVWGDHPYNSSWEIIKDADLPLPEGWQCRVVQIPVSWERAEKILTQQITPDVNAIVSFGMSGSKLIQVERIAVNLTGPTLKDCDGLLPTCEHVNPDGHPAYWTGLPYRDLVAGLSAAGIDAAENQFAGTYLCNYVFYTIMHHVATRRPDITGGFIHIPAFEDRNGMERSRLQSALSVIARIVTEAAHG